MIVEMRVYTLRFGSMDRFFDLYRQMGRDVQRRELGDPLGYYVAEVGDLNEIVHLWRYVSFEDRLKHRARLKADAGWGEFLGEVAPLILTQHSRLLLEAPL